MSWRSYLTNFKLPLNQILFFYRNQSSPSLVDQPIILSITYCPSLLKVKYLENKNCLTINLHPYLKLIIMSFKSVSVLWIILILPILKYNCQCDRLLPGQDRLQQSVVYCSQCSQFIGSSSCAWKVVRPEGGAAFPASQRTQLSAGSVRLIGR